MSKHSLFRLQAGFLIAVLFILPGARSFTAGTAELDNHLSLELLGTATAGLGFNYERSVSPHFDLGVGTVIYPMVFPPEIHVYARWNLIVFPVTPFIGCSLSYFRLTVADDSFSPFFVRLHAGAKRRTPLPIFLGAGVAYRILGDDSFRPQLIAHNLNPGLFIGMKI